MLELQLHRAGDTLSVRIGEQTATVPFADLAPFGNTWRHIYDDAEAYGRDLFDKTFREEQSRALLANLPANERLLLVTEDALTALIPWEYLRDGNNKALAARLTFVRGLPEGQRRECMALPEPVELVAIPVSPVNEPRVLNVENEWKYLVEAVTSAGQALTLKRVRPPTKSQLERSLGRRGTKIVHFMGHSTSRDGKGLLAFEDERAREHLVDAADFADALNAHVFLVVLNSCLSAVAATTEFGNIAHALVRRGLPYALGMQFSLPDDAAQVLSRALYDFLLQGYDVEEAVTRTRRALAEPGQFDRPAWLAGIPVLYTGLRTPAPPIQLSPGQPAIQPDPAKLQQTCDLTILPLAEHFMGRADKISEVLNILLAPGQRGFVLLDGLGGIGKTSLARAVAERISWHYGDRVLAISFETFSQLDANNQPIVDEGFADRFYNRLARFYELDPTQYPTTVALQQAILQRRVHVRSLLVFDNIETLIDALKNAQSAQSLAAFIRRLKEGEGAILLTSRMLPPSDWSDWNEHTIVFLTGLSEEAGATLFQALLPADRKRLARPEDCRVLSSRVDGHPLSIRLLAGRFADERANDLASFLATIEAELILAEQATPSSLEDPARQKTLYACMAYSIKRLTPEQMNVLGAANLFKAPFTPAFIEHMVANEETPVHLQTLLRLNVLEGSSRTFQEGELILLELHPMVRWYIQHHFPEPGNELQVRYGEVFVNLAQQAFEGYDKDARLRYLMRQSLVDGDSALQYLPPRDKSALAYHLAQPYSRLGQNRHALNLYEQALEIYQELGDVPKMAACQHAIAHILFWQGKPQDALALYEQSLHTSQELGDVGNVAIIQSTMADVLFQQGKPQDALAFYEQSLHTSQELGDIGNVAIIQSSMAHVLFQQGKLQDALALYEQSLRLSQELGDLRSIAVNQHAIAGVLFEQGKAQDALVLYEQSLHTKQALGDLREVAVTQSAMADVLRQQGKLQDALTLYEQSLQAYQHLGDIRSVAVSQSIMADMLFLQGKAQDALALYEQSLHTSQELGDLREVAVTQANYCRLLLQQGDHRRALKMAWQSYTSLKERDYIYDAQAVEQLLVFIKGNLLGPKEFDELWEQTMHKPQPNWLRDEAVRLQQQTLGLSTKQQKAVAANTVIVMTEMPDQRDEWRETIEGALQEARGLNRVQDIEFFAAILAVLDRQVPVLPADHPYAAILATVQADIAAGQAEQAEEVELPFDAELIPRSISALLGDAQAKMAHMQYLTALAHETQDEHVQRLLTTIQMALFSPELSQLGRDLPEVYKQAWETIVLGVEAEGIDPNIFKIIITNTLAVLGPAANQRSAWRNNLSELRNQATAHGNRNLTALLDAVIGLVDANGNPHGLGEGLRGSYAQTWQAIVEQLPQ